MLLFATNAGVNTPVQGSQGPFIFPGWSYDVAMLSGPRAIYSLQDQAFFNVTGGTGVTLFAISIASYTAGGSLDISGTTAGGAPPNPFTITAPPFPNIVTVLLDQSWQGVSSVVLTTQGLRGPNLFELNYV